ncbi:MAG: Na(+)-translocating NADH-quinone reductase subunit F [Bacteroidota bacterium]
MKTTKRFDEAINKIYMAFHNNHLNPEDCAACAVGNILDRRDFWKHLSDDHGSLNLNYVGRFHEMRGKRFNGYSPSELLRIEQAFLDGCGYQLPFRHNNLRPENPTDSNVLFRGLCAVVQLLCELDGIINIMDYHKLFDLDTISNKQNAIMAS